MATDHFPGASGVRSFSGVSVATARAAAPGVSRSTSSAAVANQPEHGRRILRPQLRRILEVFEKTDISTPNIRFPASV